MSIAFVDQAKIFVKAGNGGTGSSSLYRDKFMRWGKPDGGDGGKGSDIIIRSDRNLHTLLDLKYNQHFSGAHGGHGSSNNKRGREGQPLVIRVPVGTTVTDAKNNCILRDLKDDREEIVAASGGKGGKGNNKHNLQGEPGEPGEAKELILDLKLIAEVGVVGFPNAGKSTLISHISNAQPKIAAYPFTTKFPVLGLVRHKNKNFIAADIPGLIKGSAEGRGLGDRFLRHVERTKILIHMIDMAGFEGRDPLEDYKTINRELKGYAAALGRKIQVIAANKMDLEGAKENLKKFKKVIKKKVYPISALNKDGLEELLDAVAEKL
ncbi:MAG: GTPase ObgE [Candidatus Omnitrophica bacterium]|nr:GTPase ObgE [Candidatus Omnitrophota bacterium]